MIPAASSASNSLLIILSHPCSLPPSHTGSLLKKTAVKGHSDLDFFVRPQQPTARAPGRAPPAVNALVLRRLRDLVLQRLEGEMFDYRAAHKRYKG